MHVFFTNGARKKDSTYQKKKKKKNPSTDLTPFTKINLNYIIDLGHPGWHSGKEPTCNAGDLGSVGWEDLLVEEMPTHSSILAWKIPWTEDSGGLTKSIGQSWT